MKKSVLILLVCLVAGSATMIFLFAASSTKGDVLENGQLDKGMVLGVDEYNETNGFPISESVGMFPVSNPYTSPLPPVKNNPVNEIEISSVKGMVIDAETDEILFAKNADTKTPIASISKLMTALVFLDNNPGWETIYQLKPEDRRDGGKIYLYTGDRVYVKDLLNLSLTASANTATIALVKSTGLSEFEFVEKMNQKAREMGLVNTSFLEPVGLSAYNVSTAREVAKVLKEALEHEEISNALLASSYEFYTLDKRHKIAYNTDLLLKDLDENLVMEGGKTGYTDLAGYCFVSKIANKDGNNPVISVVLDDVDHYSRFSEVEKMAKWAYSNYIW